MSIEFQKQEGSSNREVFCEEIILKYFAKFGGKVLRWNPHFSKVADHWANFTKVSSIGRRLFSTQSPSRHTTSFQRL